MSFLFTYTAAVLTIIFVVTAALLFYKGRKDALTTIFILYVLASAVWIGGNVVADISFQDDMLVVASGVAFAGGTFLVTFFLIFVDTFIDRRLPSHTRLIIYFLPSVLFTIFSFSKYAVLGTAYPDGEPAQIVPGLQYYASPLFLFSAAFYGMRRLTKEYYREKGRRKLQILYITVGFAGLFLGETLFSLVLPILGELRYFNLAPQFSLIFVIASGYAIFKHNLLDIRIVIQRGLIYSVLLLGIVAVYLTILSFLRVTVDHMTEETGIISAVLSMILGIFTVPYIDRYLRKKTDAWFFKDTYDYANTLYKLSDNIGNKLVLDDIVKMTQAELQQLFKAEFVHMTVLTAKEAIGQHLQDGEVDYQTPHIGIRQNNTLIGYMHLGGKLSGDLYTKDDIALLNTFTNQVAIAVENARLFKEVEDYSLELEKRVEKRTHEVLQLQNREKQLLLDISHNLQTPLTVVKGKLGMIQKDMLKKEELLAFEKSIDDISAFIYELLHFSQFEAEQQKMKKELFSLSSTISEQIEYFEVITQAENILLEHMVEPDILLWGNQEKIIELVTNIVSNAVKYMGPHRRKIRITLEKKEGQIVLTVADTGMGISDADLPHIYERFYRTNNSEKKSIKGTGLGLAICKKIIELHGGSMTVQSSLGIGTTFKVILPSSEGSSLLQP